MISVIVFSKQRPLQLRAYIESLLYYSSLAESSIYVLYRETTEISYNALQSLFPKVNWVAEQNFYHDLISILSDCEEHVLLGCDDVFFKSHFCVETCTNALDRNKDLIAFSLRLGLNLQIKEEVKVEDEYLIWDWTTSSLDGSGWDYPWDVSASVYRKSDILYLLSLYDNLANPNLLEGIIATYYFRAHGLSWRKKMACFNTSKSVTLQINRVQDIYPENPIDGSTNTSVEELYKLFLSGHQLNWKAFRDCENSSIHVGSKYFQLTKSTCPSSKATIGSQLTGETKRPHGQGEHPYAAASIEFLGETTTLFTFAPETDELSAIVHQSKKFYEFYILEFLCLLGEQNVILDIGANFGNHTLFFSRFLKHESIYAFEPIKDNYEILKKNCPGVFCIRRAVSSTPTEKIMAVDRDFMGRAYVHGEGCEGSFQRIEKVSSIRLDDFYYGDVSLIKIDVEGHELDVLKGGQSLLRQHMPNILIESCDVKAVDYLQTQGYTPLLLFPGRNFFMAPTGSETHRWVHGLPDKILSLWRRFPSLFPSSQSNSARHGLHEICLDSYEHIYLQYDYS